MRPGILPLALLAALAAPPLAVAPSDVASVPLGVAPSEVASHSTAPASGPGAPGVIEGHVDLHPPPARRAPRRYPGAGPAGARRVQEIPALAYLAGTAGGGRPGPAAVMAQRDTAFAPSALVVTVGSEVAFPNHDDFFHNVFSYSEPQRFDLGRYPQGETKTVRFDRPGIVRVYCEVHETMRATIVVTENAHHAVVAADGSFRLEGVPEGRQVVRVWHADLGEAEAEVVVPSGGVVRVELTLK